MDARELLILRHGKADKKAICEDRARPLKDGGKRAVQRIGNWLWQQHMRPDIIISSPAERARTSAQKCSKSMEIYDRGIRLDERLYSGDVQAVIQLLEECPTDGSRVMLVGHNPLLEQLVSYLAGEDIALSAGHLVRLAMPDDWRTLPPKSANIIEVVNPKILADGFPYPAPNGKETRPRPAYYYTQSAVIPYRKEDNGQVKFLVIGSSKKKHWVVPKGIKDPGLTPQQSAAKEAWEEAGIRGEVMDEKLGEYSVEKWGGVCSVAVYPMQVSEEAGDDQWEENHRLRQWLNADEAAACLKQPELSSMLLELAARL